MGNATPLGTMLTTMLFGFFYALSNFARTFNMPDQLVSMLPYVAVMIGLVIYSIIKRNKEMKKLNQKD